MKYAAATLALIVLVPARSLAQVVTRVSVHSSGAQANGASLHGALSQDGRFIAFESSATNLVAGDTNGAGDVFVRDCTLATTELVSLSSSGLPGSGESSHPAISADGSAVAFESLAENLIANDLGGYRDIFVRDRASSTTSRVSVRSDGDSGNQASYSPSLSDDGRFVAFASHATNLVAGDTNGQQDMFVHDRATSTTIRVSVSSAGTQTNDTTFGGVISGNGRWVAMMSNANNLVAGDTNGFADIFLRDLQTSLTTRVSLTSSGAQANYASTGMSISRDGRYIAFASAATNFVPGDTNGVLDVFVRDVVASTTQRVSVDSSGIQGNSYSYDPWLSADGQRIAFESTADNLVPGDHNNAVDVFVHDLATGATTRASVSTIGVTATLLGCDDARISADGLRIGFSSEAGHWVGGDTNNASDEFVRDLPDPQFPSYCTAGVSTSGCRAAISATGSPSASNASSFTLSVFDVEGAKFGIVFYGVSGQTATPWGAGTSFLCVKAPTQRMGQFSSGGDAGECNGMLWLDWNAFVAAHANALGAPFTAGETVDAQCWYRDPPAPKTTNLSDGVHFVVGP